VAIGVPMPLGGWNGNASAPDFRDFRDIPFPRTESVSPDFAGRRCSRQPLCERDHLEGNSRSVYHARQSMSTSAQRDGGCCACPVRKGARARGEWLLVDDSDPTGAAYYSAPDGFFYGGTGVLLSRGLLDSISASEWQLCARRLVCGSSDWRLHTCLLNLARTRVQLVRSTANHDFWASALAGYRLGAAAFNQQVQTNAIFSTLHMDGDLSLHVLHRLASGLATPRCPWIMHKLRMECVLPVYRASAPCLGNGRARNAAATSWADAGVLSQCVDVR